MPNPRMKQRRVVHKSTAGILKPIPEAVDLVGNPPPRLTTKTVALLHQRGSANRRSDRHDPESPTTGPHRASSRRCLSRLARKAPARVPLFSKLAKVRPFAFLSFALQGVA